MNRYLAIIIFVFVFVFVKSFLIEPNSLVATDYSVEDKNLIGVKVAFITDVHLKRGDFKKIDRIVELTKNHNPNIIILGGDLVSENKKGVLPNINLLVQKLKQIQAPIFSVLGESDWGTNGEKIKTVLESNGVHVLDDSNYRIIINRKYVDIIGLADYKTKNPDINNAFRRTRMPRIVVSHNPDIYYDIMDDASVILSGHTHGGQFILPFTPPLIVSSKFGAEFASGIIKKTHNVMIISKGIGTVGIPARLNCLPEVVFVNFR